MDAFAPVPIDSMDHIPYCLAPLRRVKYTLATEPQDEVFGEVTATVSPEEWVTPGAPVRIGYHAAELFILLIEPMETVSKGTELFFEVLAPGHLREPSPDRMLRYFGPKFRNAKMDFLNVARTVSSDEFQYQSLYRSDFNHLTNALLGVKTLKVSAFSMDSGKGPVKGLKSTTSPRISYWYSAQSP